MSAASAVSLERSAAGDRNPWLVAIIVSMATFMEVLDTSVANVSLQHIAGELSATADESTWVLTSYLVSNAIILPISGWLSTVVGRKRFYLMCVTLFGVSSLCCGLAPSLGWLIVFRVLQGLGGRPRAERAIDFGGHLHPGPARAGFRPVRHRGGGGADTGPDARRLDHR